MTSLSIVYRVIHAKISIVHFLLQLSVVLSHVPLMNFNYPCVCVCVCVCVVLSECGGVHIKDQ